MFTLNISQKFIGYLIVISFIPLLLVGIVSYQISANLLQEEASRSTMETINSQRDYLDLQLRQIESLIANLSGVDTIRDSIEDADDNPGTFSALNTQTQIGYILNGYSNLDGLVSIDIFTLNGDHYQVGDTLNLDDLRTDISDRLFEETLANEGFVYWAGIEQNVNANSSYQQVMTAARVLYRFNRETLEQEPLALMLVNYNVDEIYQHISSINPGENAYMLVLDGQGRYIYHPDFAMVGQRADDSLLTMLAENDGTMTAVIDGVRMSISYTRSNLSNWTVVGLVPISTLNARALPIQNAMMGILAICFLVIVSFSWYYNRELVNPIREITNKYKAIQDNNIDNGNQHVTVKGQDEIAELGQWFNTFIDILDTRTRNEEALLENLTLTRMLYETGSHLIELRHLPDLLQVVADNFVTALSADRITVILFDTETREIKHFYKSGQGADKVVQVDYQELESGLTGWVMRYKEATFSSKESLDPRETAEIRQRRLETDCGSIMVVPLLYQGEVRGTVTAINRPAERDFTHKDVSLLMALANQAIVAIENANLMQSLSESEEKFLRAFRASPDPMTIRSMETGRYLDANESFLTATGYEREAIIGRSEQDLNLWANREQLQEFLQDLRKNGLVRNFESSIRNNKSKTELTSLLSAEMVELNGEQCFITVAKDITERKKLEEQRLHVAVERERVRVLSDFITEASHEFRTPLSIISTNSYLLGKMVATDKEQERLDTIQAQVTAITALVNSLSLMTKIDSGGHYFNNAPLNLNELLYNLHHSKTLQADNKHLNFHFEQPESPLTIYGDSEYLSLAIQKILENALQFTEAGDTISLKLTQNAHRAKIDIQDTGMGIKAGDLPHIFKRFYQVDKAGTLRGFGLGLPIAKSVIEHYGGEIEVESIFGDGTRFTVYLPLYPQLEAD